MNRISITALALLLTACGPGKEAATQRRADESWPAVTQPLRDSAGRRPDLTPRQERRLIAAKARAAAKVAKAQPRTVPKKVTVAKGGVYAPAAEQVNSAYKPTAATAQGDSATATNVQAKKSAVAVGEGSSAHQELPAKKPFPWWLLAVVVLVILWIVRGVRTGKWSL